MSESENGTDCRATWAASSESECAGWRHHCALPHGHSGPHVEAPWLRPTADETTLPVAPPAPVPSPEAIGDPEQTPVVQLPPDLVAFLERTRCPECGLINHRHTDGCGRAGKESVGIDEAHEMAEHDARIRREALRDAAEMLRLDLDEPWGMRAANRVEDLAERIGGQQ